MDKENQTKILAHLEEGYVVTVREERKTYDIGYVNEWNGVKGLNGYHSECLPRMLYLTPQEALHETMKEVGNGRYELTRKKNVGNAINIPRYAY